MIGRLTVRLDFGDGDTPRIIGQLGRDPGRRVAVFEWDQGFGEHPLPVSPITVRRPHGLLYPNANRAASLPGMFEDSLPDGWGRLVLDRELSKRGISGAEISDLDRLAFVGCHGMGALTYEPETGPLAETGIDLDWFEDLIPRVEDGASAEELARLRVISGGSQGARPKFVAWIDAANRTMHDHRLPARDGWRPVLIKGRASSDPAGAIEAECAYGAALVAAGITTSAMTLLDGRQERFFATDRFDRVGEARLHMASVAGLLDCGMAHGAVDYVDLIKLARLLCRHVGAVEEMFRRMVFNVRALNRDDHVRNHAFLMDGAGAWRMAPAFDVSFSSGPGGEHSLAVAGEGRQPGRAAFAEVAAMAGLKPKRRDAIIDEVDAALADWPRWAADFDVPKPLARRIAQDQTAARAWP